MDESSKECAPSRQATGREGKQEDNRPNALGTIVAILSDSQRLRHISTEWATRQELALALECHPDTVARRCRRVGVNERIVLTPEHRARSEFFMRDVRDLLLRCEP